VLNIVLYGFKGVGKSTLAAELATGLGATLVDTDLVIERIHADRTGQTKTFRQIYQENGSDYFRQLEAEAVASCADQVGAVIALGGSAFRDGRNRATLRRNGIFVFLDAPASVLAERVRHSVPPFLDPEDLEGSIARRNEPYADLYAAHADIVLDCASGTPSELAAELTEVLSQYCTTLMHSPSSFGTMVRMLTFGESHGEAVGVVLDGVPPGLVLDVERIQKELDRRRPGQSAITSPRPEADRVHVLSGLFEGRTTGTPICMVIYNEAKDPSAYDALRHVFRPGHADYAYLRKYGIRDHRGGGRSSGRETAARVAAGAVALSELEKQGVRFIAHSIEIAGIRARAFQPESIETNPVRCADPDAAVKMERAIIQARDAGDSVGGLVELRITGLPAGLGDPVFYKLDALLAHAVLSIGAVKGIEFGSGFGCATMKGSEHNDPMTADGFASNNAGGILGGISTGQDVVLRFPVKPTASISATQNTIDDMGRETTISVRGRHDPCIVPRVAPVAEAMAAWVIWNAWLWQQRMEESGSTGQGSP